MGKYLKCLKESKDLTEEEKIKSLDEVLKEIVNLNISVKYIYIHQKVQTSIVLEEKNLVLKKISNISKKDRDLRKKKY